MPRSASSRAAFANRLANGSTFRASSRSRRAISVVSAEWVIGNSSSADAGAGESAGPHAIAAPTRPSAQRAATDLTAEEPGS